MSDKEIVESADDYGSEGSPKDSSKESPIKLPPQLTRIIDTLPEEEQKVVRAMFMAVSVKQSSSFRGPVPPPDMLKGYNDVIPNGAERMFNMAEEQSRHRMALETNTIAEQQRQGSKGQNLGFIIGLAGLFVAAFCAYFGHDGVGGIIGVVDLVGLVGLFVIGKYKQDKDLSEKSSNK